MAPYLSRIATAQRVATMLITEILSRNARMYGRETALIERAPEIDRRDSHVNWS